MMFVVVDFSSFRFVPSGSDAITTDCWSFAEIRLSPLVVVELVRTPWGLIGVLPRPCSSLANAWSG